jgi:hypothetical protein
MRKYIKETMEDGRVAVLESYGGTSLMLFGIFPSHVEADLVIAKIEGR